MDLAYTAIGCARPISLLAYTTSGYTSREIDLAYTTDLRSRVHNYLEHRVHCLGSRVVGYASSIHT